MLKYVNTDIVFQEVPDEVSLAVNLSNCPCRCPGCHSSYLAGDVGAPLTPALLDQWVEQYRGTITCVALMGGDAEPHEVQRLAEHLHRRFKGLKVAWYSGRQRLALGVRKETFDYLKLGPYIAHLGGLSSPRTNQRMYRKKGDAEFEDITYRFQKRELAVGE